MKVVLDTHIWVWWLLPDSPLPARERTALDRIATDNGILLPAMCLWEAQMLLGPMFIAPHRIVLDPTDDWSLCIPSAV